MDSDSDSDTPVLIPWMVERVQEDGTPFPERQIIYHRIPVVPRPRPYETPMGNLYNSIRPSAQALQTDFEKRIALHRSGFNDNASTSTFGEVDFSPPASPDPEPQADPHWLNSNVLQESQDLIELQTQRLDTVVPIEIGNATGLFNDADSYMADETEHGNVEGALFENSSDAGSVFELDIEDIDDSDQSGDNEEKSDDDDDEVKKAHFSQKPTDSALLGVLPMIFLKEPDMD